MHDNLKIRLFIEEHKVLWDEYAEYVVEKQHNPQRTELVKTLSKLKPEYGLIPDSPPYLAKIAKMYYNAKKRNST